MDVVDHIAAIVENGRRLADAAASIRLDAAVPTCPGWDVRELVRHTGAIHRWATGYVRDARTEPWDVDLGDVVGTWPSDAELDEWFRRGYADLAETLERAPDDLECFTFLAAPSPKAMWARRQAHETAIHRADAEAARGTEPVFAAEFAVDGIDELLSAFITRPGRGPRAEATRPVLVTAADTGDVWHVGISQGDVLTTRQPAPAACMVRGTASQLYLALWNRRPFDGLEVTGDRTLLDEWREQVQITWD